MKKNSFVFLLVATVLMALPASYEPHHFAKALLAGALLQSFAYSLVMLALTYKSVVLKRLFFTILYLLFCTESFLFFRFGSRLDPNMLTLMLQTSARETREFASVYLLSPSTLYILVIFIACYTGIYLLLGKETPPIKWMKSWLVRIAMCILAVLGFALPYLPLPFAMGQNTINELWMSAAFVKERHAEMDIMAEMIDKIEISQSPADEEAPVMVFVIGESFNKQHSSLYGYTLRTSPFLEEERDRGNLIYYTHAMSPTNGTDFAMRFLFTLKGCEQTDTADVHPFVLMPAVFKKANYHVAYFDNQYTRLSGGALDYSCGYFLNPNYINTHCFDFRNTEIQKYDGDFVSLYRTSFFREPKSLNIIHLMGQHFDAAMRYPSAFGRFNQDDVKRDDLTRNQRQQVAEYDNATLYNDYVLKMIIDEFRDANSIVIYLSDHGEQIYDKPHCYLGRGFGSTDEEETRVAVYEVPFMAWCSDKFIQEHGDTYNALKVNAAQTICTADVAYLLFDIAGIDFNYNIKSRSIIDSTFVPHTVQFE